MMGRAKRRLAIAVTNNRVGYVYCRGNELVEFGLSSEAVKSVETIFIQTARWVRLYRPSEVITEECLANSRKSRRTRALIETVGAAARDRGVKHIQVVRVRRFKNKYEEAAAIAMQYSDLMDWLPKKRLNYENEKPQIIYFEAMSLWLSHIGVHIPKQEDRRKEDEGTMPVSSLFTMACESLL